MSVIIANYDMRGSEAWENIFFQELDDNLIVICLASDDFNPFGHIVHKNHDILIPKWVRKKTHKVNVVNVEKFCF